MRGVASTLLARSRCVLTRAVRLFIATAAAGAVIAAPAVAQAKTATVYTGPPPNIGKLVPASAGLSKSFQAKYNPDVNAFFPQKVRIHVGDTVSFIRGMMPHTIDIPPVGGSDLPFFVTGSPVEGVNDYACLIHPFMRGTIIVTK